MMQWEIVIGLEIHVQLSTRAKIFSGASTAFGAEPNQQACAIDLALPGVLPTLNQGAVQKALQFGLAVNARINQRSCFARKNYFYPDLPKGYQISQLDLPIVAEGAMDIVVGRGDDAYEKNIRITRAHLEEDAGKSLHENIPNASGIDLNRAGTPLLEIVSEPDLRSAQEAVAYARTMHTLVRWIGICDGNMQEGSFRMDANVSVRPVGSEVLGTRCEIKNLNSFRFLERAIEFEARRQIELIEDGRVVRQETRLYDADRDETRTMRSKEDAHDYRYFPDPDLPMLVVDDDVMVDVRATLPELPRAKQARFRDQYALSAYDATLLTQSAETAAYFETMLATCGQASMAKLCANWMNGELASALNEAGLDIITSPVTAATLAQVIVRIQDGTLSSKTAKDVFRALWSSNTATPACVDRIIDEQGLRQISDSGEIDRLIDHVLQANAAMVAEFKAGKEKAFNALVGQIMKASQGKANPQQVNTVLKQKLDEA